MPRALRSPLLGSILAVLIVTILAACGSGSPGNPGSNSSDGSRVLRISAIPDQDPQELQRTFGAFSEYLGDRLDIEVEYVPLTDYAASVTAFQRGDLPLVFFGGLTGVQARSRVDGSVPIAQRDIDQEFQSVFVAHVDSGIEPFDDVIGLRLLAGHSITFGSDTSTSGRLMPQHFLSQAGLEIGDFGGEPGFSGSHDATATLVEAGTYDVGALNASLWDKRVGAGTIDTNKVREVFRTPAYNDYHWLARPDIDETFGEGFTERLKDAILAIDGDTAVEREILELFSASAFIPTEASNYEQIEAIAQELGLLN